MNPRRSSRTQPPVGANSNSSTSIPSSTSSLRAERSTRSHNKQSSPQKSGTPQSALSSESGGGSGRAHDSEPPQSRRLRRGQENTEAEEDDTAKVEEDELDDEIAEENEVTRCVCGHQDYPGPPDQRHPKGGNAAVDAQGEEAGGLFIQCDVCKVWQHGGCVGIMDEATSPDDYFCEECKPDLHDVSTSKTGQKYSLYIPVHEKSSSKSHRKSSASKDADSRTAKEREKAARADALAKRRSTMNSRSAYDEEEVLRAVLEQSKKDGGLGSESNTRKGKRGRDDSDDVKQDSKRQRTASELSSASRSQSQSPTAGSDQDAKGAKQKPRGAAARSQREKELREKERERENSASKRRGRADRRRVDESEQPNDALDAARPSTAPSDVDPSASQPPDTPHLVPSATKSHKKGAGGKGQSKRGKNQYTRDNTQTPLDADTPHTNGDRKGRRDKDGNSPAGNGRSGDNTDNGSGREAAGADQARPTATSGATIGETTIGRGRGKGRQMNLQKTSMNEMRRKVHSMLNYVGQAQVEMASKKSFQVALDKVLLASGGAVKSIPANAKLTETPKDDVDKQKEKDKSTEKKEANELENSGASGGTNSAGSGSTSLKELMKGLDGFKELPTTEMMNMLSTRLVLWQQEYGKLGEK